MNKKYKEGDIIEGQIDFLNNGNASIKLEDKEIFIYKKNTLNAFHLDKVKVKLVQRGKKLEGEVLSVLERFKDEWVGKVQINKNTTFVVLDNPKILVDFWVKNRPEDLKDGQKVVVKLVEWDGSKSPIGEIKTILGESGDNNVEMNSIMIEYGLPIEFPKQVEMEAEKIKEDITEEDIKERKDLRHIPTTVIDPIGSRDADDSLSVEYVGDYVNVYINIADVTHYVKPGSELDKEAFRRSTSVYLVDRCIPMLPEKLSNGVCSLNPNVDRLAYTVMVKLDKEGYVKGTWIGRTIIHVDKKYTYEDAQEILEGKDDIYARELRTLDELAKKRRKRRIENGSFEIDGREVRFNLDENGKPIGVYIKEQKDSNKLIEEFMVLANETVSEYTFNSYKGENIYRFHAKPSDERLLELKRVCENFGYNIDISLEDAGLKAELNRLTKEIKGKPEENMISTLLVRSMAKAVYDNKNSHYGLGLEFYSHFTSPIRRYSDVILHRNLTLTLDKREGKSDKMDKVFTHLNEREIVAAKASRDSIKYKQAEYLQDKIGHVFKGIVSGVTQWGVYVQIPDNGCEGMIRLSYLPNFDIDIDNYSAYNIKTGEQIRLGDELSIKVVKIDLEKKSIDFARF